MPLGIPETGSKPSDKKKESKKTAKDSKKVGSAVVGPVVSQPRRTGEAAGSAPPEAVRYWDELIRRQKDKDKDSGKGEDQAKTSKPKPRNADSKAKSKAGTEGAADSSAPAVSPDLPVRRPEADVVSLADWQAGRRRQGGAEADDTAGKTPPEDTKPAEATEMAAGKVPDDAAKDRLAEVVSLDEYRQKKAAAVETPSEGRVQAGQAEAEYALAAGAEPPDMPPPLAAWMGRNEAASPDDGRVLDMRHRAPGNPGEGSGEGNQNGEGQAQPVPPGSEAAYNGKFDEGPGAAGGQGAGRGSEAGGGAAAPDGSEAMDMPLPEAAGRGSNPEDYDYPAGLGGLDPEHPGLAAAAAHGFGGGRGGSGGGGGGDFAAVPGFGRGPGSDFGPGNPNGPHVPSGYERTAADVSRAAWMGLIAGWFLGRRGKNKAVKRAVAATQRQLSRQSPAPDAHRYALAESTVPAASATGAPSAERVQSAATGKPERPVSTADIRTVRERTAPSADWLRGGAGGRGLERARALPLAEALAIPAVVLARKAAAGGVEKLRPAPGSSSEAHLDQPRLMELAKVIKIDGVRLADVYHAKQIDEEGLRAVVDTYLRGGDVQKQLSHEVVEKQKSFERDPLNRRRSRGQLRGTLSQAGATIAGKTASAARTIQQATQQAAATTSKSLASGAHKAQDKVVHSSDGQHWAGIVAIAVLYTIILILILT